MIPVELLEDRLIPGTKPLQITNDTLIPAEPHSLPKNLERILLPPGQQQHSPEIAVMEGIFRLLGDCLMAELDSTFELSPHRGKTEGKVGAGFPASLDIHGSLETDQGEMGMVMVKGGDPFGN